MMSIGLHCRLIGRPGRIESLRRFINYIQQKIKFGAQNASKSPIIAQKLFLRYGFWRTRPSLMNRAQFTNRFSNVFELSPWVAEEVFKLELGQHMTRQQVYIMRSVGFLGQPAKQKNTRFYCHIQILVEN